MALFDSLESLATSTLSTNSCEDAATTTDKLKVAGGLMQALQDHPEGVQGVLDSLNENGLSDHVEQWTTGQSTTATCDQVATGLSGTGLIEAAAEHAGVSPEVAHTALTEVLPVVLAHVAPNGEAAPPDLLGCLATSLFSRFL